MNNPDEVCIACGKHCQELPHCSEEPCPLVDCEAFFRWEKRFEKGLSDEDYLRRRISRALHVPSHHLPPSGERDEA